VIHSACAACGSKFTYRPDSALTGSYWMCHCGHKTPINNLGPHAHPDIVLRLDELALIHEREMHVRDNNTSHALREAAGVIRGLRAEAKKTDEYREEMRLLNRQQARIDAIRGEPQGAPPRAASGYTPEARTAAIDKRVSRVEGILKRRGWF